MALTTKADYSLSYVFQVFRCVAFKAKGRDDILAGIREFSRYLTVLPPGTWDPTTRIEPLDAVPTQVCILTMNLLMRRWFI